MITPQLVFMVAGIVSLVTSVILLIVSIAYFMRNDIRGVMDDLSGKTRTSGTATHARSESGRAKRQKRKGHTSIQDQVSQDASVRETQGDGFQSLEDDLDTVLDTKLRKVTPGISSDTHNINDDTPTVVTSIGEYHQEDSHEMKLKNQNGSDVLDGTEGALPTQVESEPVAYGNQFVVTKSILAIHSQEIIAVG